MATTPTICTLSIKISATITTPPYQNRDNFRNCAVSSLIYVLKNYNVSLEFIGYQPDSVGVHPGDSDHTEYEDVLIASISLDRNPLIHQELNEKQRKEEIIRLLIETFENKTNRHLEVEWKNEMDKRVNVEMSSDWKLYLKQG